MNKTENSSSSKVPFAFKFKAASLTDRGKERECNEDAVAFLPEHNFFAIADGMGGFVDGGQTANTVVAILPAVINDIESQLPTDAVPAKAGKLFLERIKILSDNIAENGNLEHPGIFGTTLTAVWFVEKSAVFANLGDSRAYILDTENQLRQITRDHSIVGILLEQDEITSKEAENHPARGQLTRYIGMPSPALPENFIETTKAGDRILLCSDGLSGMVPDDKIAELLAAGENPQKICRTLVNVANAAGGKDNITVVVIIVGDKIKDLDMLKKIDSAYELITETQEVEA